MKVQLKPYIILFEYSYRGLNRIAMLRFYRVKCSITCIMQGKMCIIACKMQVK